ncbi:hypothetical protein CPB86DRAFT_720040 [Serendipita vermifera]|nr:hypothetical protein CPB86DRAFT_720040 [Serendipita vermifera]
MHQLFENACPNMVLHWKGVFKDLPSDEPYVIKEDVWKMIGSESFESARTTPASMVRLMGNVWEAAGKFTAEHWGFWMTWLAPYLFEGRLPQQHYEHLCLFSHIIKTATSLELTEQQIQELENDLKKWHTDYERLYYRFTASRLSACPLTIHALIHIAHDTRNAGPLSRLWEFVTERTMGTIARSVKSRRLPFSQLAETVKVREQMKTIAIRYNLPRELSIKRTRRDWSSLSGTECMFPEINKYHPSPNSCSPPADDTTVLMSPRQDEFAWEEYHRKLVAAYFKQELGLTSTIPTIMKEVPKKVTRWGKFRVFGESQIIRCKWAGDRLSQDQVRDASFVRVELLVDRYAHMREREPEFERQVFYGQLLYVVHVTYPRLRGPPTSVLLGIVQWCKDTEGDATHERVWYSEMGLHQAINIATVQCVVGRVKVGRRWGILDLSFGCARTTFLEDEEENGIEQEEEE